MTTRSSSACSDDSLIRPVPAGVRLPSVRVLTRFAPPPGSRVGGPPGDGAGNDDDRYGDPLLDLVQTAVADRPLEDVVRLLTLLESSPEHALTRAEALRSAGVVRSVTDVTRLVALLGRPSGEPDGADAVVRAAAGLRPPRDVGRLLRMLHRPPLAPRCARLAVRAAAGRPVEEVAELLGHLAAEGPERQPEPAAHDIADPGPAALVAPPAPEPADQPRTGSSALAGTRTRAAAALVFLCGAAHAPRYWAGLSHGLLGATLVASALCMLLGLALPARAALARLAAATAAVAVTTVLGAGQVLGGRFGLPDTARLWAATLAPPWLAGTAAAAAACAALGVVLAVLLGPGSRAHGGS
ncbi:hypothetical protein SAMN04490357_7178 [Streptomyces misionensis]|uniref:Uncharacterized protein n=1 Tax=Streptomyces misionensis TaxID=67331 RepID=A0A1H5GQ41_9ACTN|nr:hypothetical protein [Streptomyces misionensis]SEE17730.1 hypothetical protein SAMN04490357_7178 [Streptomyces misionensis]